MGDGRRCTGGARPEVEGGADRWAPPVGDRMREREGREAEWAAWAETEVGRGLGWAVRLDLVLFFFLFFFFFSFSFQILFKPNSNSNLFHVFKLKF
jgi:hypothetical protein